MRSDVYFAGRRGIAGRRGRSSDVVIMRMLSKSHWLAADGDSLIAGWREQVAQLLPAHLRTAGLHDCRAHVAARAARPLPQSCAPLVSLLWFLSSHWRSRQRALQCLTTFSVKGTCWRCDAITLDSAQHAQAAQLVSACRVAPFCGFLFPGTYLPNAHADGPDDHGCFPGAAAYRQVQLARRGAKVDVPRAMMLLCYQHDEPRVRLPKRQPGAEPSPLHAAMCRAKLAGVEFWQVVPGAPTIR